MAIPGCSPFFLVESDYYQHFEGLKGRKKYMQPRKQDFMSFMSQKMDSVAMVRSVCFLLEELHSAKLTARP